MSHGHSTPKHAQVIPILCRADCLQVARMTSTRVALGPLSMYGALKCRQLLERVAALPGELHNQIYEDLLNSTDRKGLASPYSDQAIILNHFLGKPNNRSWGACLSHFGHSGLGQDVLRELVGLCYSRIAIYLDFDFSDHYDHTGNRFDIPLWSLLSVKPVDPTHEPVTAISQIIIVIPQRFIADQQRLHIDEDERLFGVSTLWLMQQESSVRRPKSSSERRIGSFTSL